MEQKAQGAIEYLLIIGAAILVVAIVILAVTGALGTGQLQNKTAQGDINASLCAANCHALGPCSSNGTLTDLGCGKVISSCVVSTGGNQYCKLP